MNKTPKEIIRAMVDSYGYNRDNEYMIKVCEEVKKRLKEEADITDWTDEGNIIYGTLVCLYGDYGTSPRVGWLYDEDKKIVDEIIEEINEEIEECFKVRIELHRKGKEE